MRQEWKEPTAASLCLLPEHASGHPVEPRARGSLQWTQPGRVIVIRFKPAMIAVISEVAIAFAKQLLNTRTAHPEYHQLKKRWGWMGGLRELLVKPPAVFRQRLVHLLPVLLGHRLQRRNATAFHYVEAQACTCEIEVLDDLAAAVNSLGDDAREGLSVKLRAMKHESQAVEKDLHHPGETWK